MTFDLLPLILQYEIGGIFYTHQYEYLLIHMATDSNTQDSGCYSMFDFKANNEPSRSFTVPESDSKATSQL